MHLDEEKLKKVVGDKNANNILNLIRLMKKTEGKMPNNGRNTWIKYLVGTLVTLILFITLPTMAGYIINNDKDSRKRDTSLEEKSRNRDDKIKEDVGQKLDKIITAQTGSIIEFKERLTKIEAKL